MKKLNQRLIWLTLVLVLAVVGCQKETTIGPDEDKTDSLPDPQPASLSILSRPPGAKILLNYQDTELRTPALFDSLESGEYAIRLLLSDHFPIEATVSLNQGKHKEVSLTLESTPAYLLAYSLNDTLWVVNLDGLNPVPYAYECRLVRQWSPDGEHLVYNHGPYAKITILNRDGSLERQFDLSGGISWSHSSQQLACSDWLQGIHIYDLPTGTLHEVYGVAWTSDRVFDPGDSLIAYTIHWWGTDVRIFVVSADGGDKRPISVKMFTNPFGDVALFLNWLSDTKILFRAPHLESEKNLGGIFLLDFPTYDSLTEPVRVVDDWVEKMLVSPNKLYFAYISRGWYSKASQGLNYGVIGCWTPTVLKHKTGYFSPYWTFAWSPGSEAIVFRDGDGIHWIPLTGTAYTVIRFPPGSSYTNRGSISVGP